MDTDQLIERSRARFDHAVAKRVLKEKYEAKMIFAHAGGLWRAGPELISVLQACADETAVIADLYGTPVKITVTDMRIIAQQHWQEQMNAWLQEHQEISRKR